MDGSGSTGKDLEATTTSFESSGGESIQNLIQKNDQRDPLHNLRTSYH